MELDTLRGRTLGPMLRVRADKEEYAKKTKKEQTGEGKQERMVSWEL